MNGYLRPDPWLPAQVAAVEQSNRAESNGQALNGTATALMGLAITLSALDRAKGASEADRVKLREDLGVIIEHATRLRDLL